MLLIRFKTHKQTQHQQTNKPNQTNRTKQANKHNNKHNNDSIRTMIKNNRKTANSHDNKQNKMNHTYIHNDDKVRYENFKKHKRTMKNTQ